MTIHRLWRAMFSQNPFSADGKETKMATNTVKCLCGGQGSAAWFAKHFQFHANKDRKLPLYEITKSHRVVEDLGLDNSKRVFSREDK